MPSSGTLGGIHKTGDTIKILETGGRVDAYTLPAFTPDASASYTLVIPTYRDRFGRLQCRSVSHLFEDGGTAFVLNSSQAGIAAHSIATGRHTSGRGSINFGTRPQNLVPSRGLWGTDSIFYTPHYYPPATFSTYLSSYRIRLRPNGIYAWSRTTRRAATASNIALPAAAADVRALWGDGPTLWLAAGRRLFAVTVATGARDTSKDVTLPDTVARTARIVDITGDDDDLWVLLDDRTINRIAKP